MLNLEDINVESWEKILYANSPDDKENIEFLHQHEEAL